jgi:hypothetical protein
MLERNQLRRAGRAFTLIELLTVIAIIMVVAALAVPNFVTMMKSQKWVTATASLQGMIMRARALAANVRQDMAVEFIDQPDNGTRMWVESKSNFWERIPPLSDLQVILGAVYGYGDYRTISWIMNSEWIAAGGDAPGHHQNGSDPLRAYTNVGPDQLPAHGVTASYGDKAYQSETVALAAGLYVDETNSPNFINWNSWTSVRCYGGDNTNDIRIGTNAALVQPLEPVLCIRQIGGTEFKKVQVIRCTGRLIPAR